MNYLAFLLFSIVITKNSCSMEPPKAEKPQTSQRMDFDKVVQLHTGKYVFERTLNYVWKKLENIAEDGNLSLDLHQSLYELCTTGKETPKNQHSILRNYQLPIKIEETELHMREVIIAAHLNDYLMGHPVNPTNEDSQYLLT